MQEGKNYGLISSVGELEDHVGKIIEKGDPFGIDIETGYTGPDRPQVSLHPDDPDSLIAGISFTNDPRWARYAPISHDGSSLNLPVDETARIFWPLVQSGKAVIHNAGFELRFMSRWFREILPADVVGTTRGRFPFLADSMLMSYVAAETQSHGLKFLTHEIFRHEQKDIYSLFPNLKTTARKTLRFNALALTPEVVSYCCEDSAWCLDLFRYFDPIIQADPGLRFINDLEHQIVPILADMEDYGIVLDWKSIAAKQLEASTFLEKLNTEIQSDLSEMTGKPQNVNIGSVKQLREVLYDDLGFKTTRTTKTGGLSTDEQALTGLAHSYPVVQKILDWKQMRKLIGSYLDKYPRDYSYAGDGKVHANHLQVVVASGRFAVSDPNYQQLPKKYHFELNDGSLFECDFRSFVIAPEDHYVMGFDFSQIELRVMAGVAGEPNLLAAYANGEDVHVRTAALMYSKDPEDVTKAERAGGKTLNFSLLYQMGVQSMAERLDISVAEAEQMKERYFSAFTKIGDWVQQTMANGQLMGSVRTPFGRKVTIWELQSSDGYLRSKGDRLCVNSPIQGGASDLAKVAMVLVQKTLANSGLLDRVHMVMNIHDALEFYVHKSVPPQQLMDLLADVVSVDATKLRASLFPKSPVMVFPKIVAEWHVGLSWGSVKDVHLGKDGVLRVDTPEPPPAIVPKKSLDTPAAPTSDHRLMFVLNESPDPAALRQLVAMLAGRPGDTYPVLVLPDGEVPLAAYKTSMTPDALSEVQLLIPGVSMFWELSGVESTV